MEGVLMATDYVEAYEELWNEYSDLKDERDKALSLLDQLIIEMETEIEVLKKLGGNIKATSKCEERLRKLEQIQELLQ